MVKLRISNAPKSFEGYAYGKLASVKEDILEMSDKDADVLRFTFHVEGKVKPIEMSIITGFSIGLASQQPKKAKVRGQSKEPKYNKLTRVCISLGVLKESEINNEDISDLVGERLDGIIYDCFKFKLVPQEKNPSLNTIDMDSIKPMTEEEILKAFGDETEEFEE